MTETVSPLLWLEPEGDEPSRTALAARYAPWVLLALMTVVFAVGYSWMSLLRHAAFESHAFDLGNFDQAVWNTLHGQPFRFTDMATHQHILTTRLAIHVEPIIFLLAPLYLLHSGPQTLLVAQAVVVASGAIPAYLLARAVLHRPWVALVFPLAYLLDPSLQNAVLDDFHPVVLAAALLLWAVFFAYRDSWLAFGVFALLAAATKENIALLVAMLGIALLVRRRWSPGLLALFLGIAWFIIAVGLIIPAYNPGGQSPYLARYAYLGHGLIGVLSSPIRHPDVVLRVLGAPSRLGYLTFLLKPFAFMPVLGLPVLLLAVPSLAINMLSADGHMWSGWYQYSAEIVPFLVIASIFGVAWISRATRLSWLPVALSLLVLAASLFETRQAGFSPMGIDFGVGTMNAHKQIEQKMVDRIPRDSVVAAADEIEPHLSDRPTVYKLGTVHPKNGPAAQYLILDASLPSLPFTPARLHETAISALRHGYGVTAARDGILILHRGAPGQTIPRAFYSFLFSTTSPDVAHRDRWGNLSLRGLSFHPSSLYVDPGHPGISVDSFWVVSAPILSKVDVRFYLSPVYHGGHPAYSSRWTRSDQSPALVWRPVSRWPRGRSIEVSSMRLLPQARKTGKVDVGLAVRGLGRDLARARHVRGAPWLIRVATVNVG
ncbi:MAG: DUF2079 domain-containing protein [Chloroflexota bacterium]